MPQLDHVFVPVSRITACHHVDTLRHTALRKITCDGRLLRLIDVRVDLPKELA
jgi:hypothetical protein